MEGNRRKPIRDYVYGEVWGVPDKQKETVERRDRLALKKKVEGEEHLGIYGRLREEIGMKRCLLYTSPSPRDQRGSRMPSSA